MGFLDVQDPSGAWEERERQRGDQGSHAACKCQHNRSCPFSSRSCRRDVAGGGKHGLGHLHPGADHLPAAGRSVHLSHQVGLQGAGTEPGGTARAGSASPSPATGPGHGAGNAQGCPGRSWDGGMWEMGLVWNRSVQPSDSTSPRRCRYYSSLRLPLMYSHPYSQITVETEFDNPIYETGVSPAVRVPAGDTPEGLGWVGSQGMSPARLLREH